MASKTGQNWERQLEAMHAHYRAFGRAYVIRNSPPTRTIHKGSKSITIQVAEGPPDYLLLANNVIYLIEAKHCDHGSRWPWSKLATHQAVAFDEAEEQGAHGVIALRWGPARTTTILLWRDVRDAWWRWCAAHEVGTVQRGQGSITLQDAIELSVWHGSGVDYLDALLSASK